MTDCNQGDCLHGLISSDILVARQRFCTRTVGSSTAAVLKSDLYQYYDRSTSTWGLVSYNLGPAETIYLCPMSYCLMVGASPSAASDAMVSIKSDVEPPKAVPQLISKRDAARQCSLDFAMLRQYVAQLLNKHEANPAPGAHQPGRMTFITKQSWHQKWQAVEVYFKDAERVPGSKSMLKRVWKLEHRLKERRAKSHSKCTSCARIGALQERLIGVNTEDAQKEREFLQMLYAEHEGEHLMAREVLDEAGLMGIVNPRYIWVICVDAATQRNFEIPKFQFRPPKCFAKRPFWNFKLMACFVYGNGFYPFLIHDSQKFGANLTWTVIWKTLCALLKKHGCWPEMIHLQLDNTTGENKNEVMIMLGAWLASVKVKQVRVYFLPVGHTHIIIDQIFGIITVGLRRVELLTPRALMMNIDATMAANPQYSPKPTEWLHCLWDFSSWAKKQLQHHPLGRLFGGEVQDEDGEYKGMFDFLITRHDKDFARLQYREHCSHPYLPESGPCLTIKHRPTSPPPLQEIKGRSQWYQLDSQDIAGTILLCCKFARTLYTSQMQIHFVETWHQIFRDVPNIIALLRPELKLTFENFGNEAIPRLTNTTTNDNTTNDATAQRSYEEWKQMYAAFRKTPLAFDPVISSEQSEAEYKKARAAWMMSVGITGPSISTPSSKRTNPILLGSYVLVKTSAIGVRLYQVRTFGAMMTMYSVDLTFTGVEYAHTPNPAVPGLFGTFKQASVRVAGRNREVRHQVRRDQVIVFGATLNPGKRHLTLETLRALAIALPQEYPMPRNSQIPASHLPRKRPPPQVHTRTESSESESESDEEEDGSSGEDSSADELNEGDDSSSADSEEEDDSSDAENETGNARPREPPTAAISSSDGASSQLDRVLDADETSGQVFQEETPPTEDRMVAITLAPSDVTEGSLVFLNMHGNATAEYKSMDPPVALVFVHSKEADAWNVCWFQLAGKSFKLRNKFQVWNKFWTDANWSKKEKLKKKQIPTTEQIFKYWYTKPVDPQTLVPILIPPSLYDAGKVIQADTTRLPTTLITDVLMPLRY